MRGADDDADAREQAADLLQHPLALDRVGLHDRPLVVVERAGLVDDLVGHRDLADVVQQRAHLGLAPHVLADAELVGDLDRQLDDVLGVVAGVLVVLLEQVAQEQGGAAVGAAELEAALDARVALAAEADEQRREREHEQRADRRVGGGDRGQQAEREQEAVDAARELHLGQRLADGDARGGAQAHREVGTVERQLCRERRDVGRQVLPAGGLRAGDDEHDRRPEREGRVAGAEQGAARRPPAADDVGRGGEHDRGAHEQRHERRGKQQQHRDEHELRRHRVAGADGELDPIGHDVGSDERERQRDR